MHGKGFWGTKGSYLPANMLRAFSEELGHEFGEILARDWCKSPLHFQMYEHPTHHPASVGYSIDKDLGVWAFQTSGQCIRRPGNWVDTMALIVSLLLPTSGPSLKLLPIPRLKVPPHHR